MDRFAVLGGYDGDTVRVRMFIGKEMIDEDFPTPVIVSMEDQIKTAALARIDEIKSQGTDPAKSQIIEAQDEQVVEMTK